MKLLNSKYAQEFNTKYGHCGHVFQGRYKSTPIESEAYLLLACRYIVFNPVRANLCQHPEEWRWSSYHGILGNKADPLLNIDSLLSLLGESKSASRKQLVDFIHIGENTQNQSVFPEHPPLGEKLREEATKVWSQEVPRKEIQTPSRTLTDIFTKEQRPIATAYCSQGYHLKEIAEHLNCHYSTVSRRLHAEEIKT
jgi:hypothetical protein